MALAKRLPRNLKVNRMLILALRRPGAPTPVRLRIGDVPELETPRGKAISRVWDGGGANPLVGLRLRNSLAPGRLQFGDVPEPETDRGGCPCASPV